MERDTTPTTHHLAQPTPAPSDAPVIVLTGASAGVGRATATTFGRRGYRVALLARGHAGLEGARRDVEAGGGQALVIPADVSDADAVFAAAERVAAEWGRIDVWVNNAMATVFGPAERVPPSEWERVTKADYLGAVYGTLAALKHMRPRNTGTIVQIGSALSYRSIPLQAPYCAAKFAIRGFTDSLRTELSHDGSRIRLTMVQLPGVNTPQFAWSRTHPHAAPPPPCGGLVPTGGRSRTNRARGRAGPARAMGRAAGHPSHSRLHADPRAPRSLPRRERL